LIESSKKLQINYKKYSV